MSATSFLLTTFAFHAARRRPRRGSSPSFPLNVTFLAGLASFAFGTFPLPFLPGRHVAKWNGTIWLALSGVGLIGFVAILLTPGSDSSSDQHHVGLVPVLVVYSVFAVQSLSAMMYFHKHPIEKSETEADEPTEGPVVLPTAEV